MATFSHGIKSLLLSLLAVSVLAWGTAYKCSLYKSYAEQSKTVVAKLDTRISDVAKADLDDSLAHPDQPVLLKVELPASVPKGSQERSTDEVRPSQVLLLRRSPLLSLRPPPVQTRANF